MFYFCKLVYWNLTGWRNLGKFQSMCLCVLQMTALSLKNKDTKRAANRIPNLDNPRADVLTALHPSWRQGLALAEHTVSSGAWAPCHSNADRCQGERAAHWPRDSAGTVLQLLARLLTNPTVLQSLTEGSWQPLSHVAACPVSCFPQVSLLRLPGKSSKGTITALMWALQDWV